MVREDTAIILNDDSMVSSFGFEKNLSTITAWVLILLLSYDKSTISPLGREIFGGYNDQCNSATGAFNIPYLRSTLSEGTH